MGTKEFLGQKLLYMTKRQKKYLETSKTTNISYNSFKKLLETSLENLNKPEASWTRADLIASGAQFPSTFMGKTTYIDPDNTFLVGYKAFIDLRSAYRFMAEHAQTALNDTALCKECLYLTAYCLKCLCGWSQDDELHVTIDDEYLEDCGNIFYLNIERDTTQIKDTLAEFLEPVPPIQETELTVNTNELKDIMKIWIEKHTFPH